MKWEFDIEQAEYEQAHSIGAIIGERWDFHIPDNVIRNMGQDKPDDVEKLIIRLTELELKCVEQGQRIAELVALNANREYNLQLLKRKLKKLRAHA